MNKVKIMSLLVLEQDAAIDMFFKFRKRKIKCCISWTAIRRQTL